MGCNCKKGEAGYIDSNESTEKGGQSILMYIVKTIGFLVTLVLLPIINLVIIWFIFRTLVLNKDVDIKALLLAIGNSIKKPEEIEEEDDEELESLTEDDVIMLNVEEIKKK
jgi:hypothetical protein